MQNFGVIIACCYKDYNLAKGCCSSIRYFLGDVPICLLIDGDFSIKELEKTYGVKAIYRHDIQHRVLRERCFGSGHTKLISFWESPWSNFLVLDADTIVWGNLLKQINFQEYDLVANQESASPEQINTSFIDTNEINKHFPKHNWQKHSYFNSGAYFGKRGIFTLEEYIQLLDLQKANPFLFRRTDQAVFNLMVHRAIDQERLKVKYHKNLQFLVPLYDLNFVAENIKIQNNKPFLSHELNATVVHWAGVKPTIYTSDTYTEPMLFFRRKFLDDAYRIKGIRANVNLIKEDFSRYPKRLLPKVLYRKVFSS